MEGATLSSPDAERMAGTTGLEPAASAVTGQRSNQLNYVPRLKIRDLLKSLAGSGVCRFRIQRTVCLHCPVQRLFPAERPINRPIELRLAWLVTEIILSQAFGTEGPPLLSDGLAP